MKGTSKKITKEIKKGKYWKSGKTPRTLETLKPYDQTAYFNYRKNRKTDHEIGTDRTLFSKSVMAIYEAIGELITENEGGVFLEEYGYFNGMVIPWANNGLNYKNVKDPYFHTDGYCYTLQFFSLISRRSCMRGMIMDRTFNYKVKNSLSKALFEGHRPKLYNTALESIHGYKKWSLK